MRSSHLRKINEFFDLDDTLLGRLRTEAEIQNSLSPWTRDIPPIHPVLRLSHDRGEWDEVYLIINLCIHLPLHEVIIEAIRDISQHYYPRRLVQRRYDYDSAERERHTLVQNLGITASNVWQTIFCHAIFTEFWFNMLHKHSAATLRAEIERLIAGNQEDANLIEHLNLFLEMYINNEHY